MTVKKKIIFLSVLLILTVIALVLSACDPNADTVDKASQNAQFVSFRKKVVRILKDNGIFVNDLDGASVSASVQSGTPADRADLLYAGDDKITQIGKVLARSEYSVNADGYDFALKQVYSIALKMSLCVGDGMLNYFDEKEFYNIPVYIPDMFIVITEDGNKSCMYGYQKTSDGVEHVQKIEVVFNSDDDYYFTVTEPTGDWIAADDYGDQMYFYGDSDRRFLMFRAGYESVYTPNGTDFYETHDETALNDCFGILGKQTFECNIAEYRKIKDNVKHTFTNEQSTALMDKYFKDVQSSIQDRPSEFIYQDCGGKNVLMGYYANEGETEVAIPSGVKYISSQFLIEDYSGAVTSLVIPATVAEIIDSDGNPCSDANYVRFELSGQSGAKLLQNITVQQGSPLFKSGSGHLTLKNGVCIYALDAACENLDVDVIMRAYAQSLLEIQYKRVFQITADTVNIRLDDIARGTLYGFDEYTVIEQLQKVLNASSVSEYDVSVSLTDGDNEQNFGSLRLETELNSDVTVNVNFGECGASDQLFFDMAFTNGSKVKRNVTVNVTGFTYSTYLSVGPKQPEAEKGEEAQYVSDSSVYTAFNLDVPKFYFDGLCYGRLTRDVQNSQVSFDTDEDGKYRYFEISDANTNPSHSWLHCTLNVTGDVRDNDVITIPAELFGLTVFRVRIDVSAVAGKKVTVILPDSAEFDCVEFYSSQDEQSVTLDNADFVISGGGGLELLKSRITDYDWDESYSVSFTLRSDGETALHQTGWEFGGGNPDNEIKSFTLYNDELTSEMRTVEYSVRLGAVLSENADASRAYFAYPQDCNNDDPDGKFKPLTLFVDGQGRLCAEVADIEENGTYILVARQIGRHTVTAVWQFGGQSFDTEVTVSAEQKDGKTYFNAFVGQFVPSFGQADEYECVTYDFDAVGKAEFYGWFDLAYTVTEKERDPDNPEHVTAEQSYRGGRKIMLVLRNGDIRVKQKDEFKLLETVAHVDGQTFNHTVRVGSEYQCRFAVDEWNLQDTGNYEYFAVYENNGGQAWQNIAIERIDGTLYAITNGTPPREFTLKRLELGSREYRLQGDYYDLTLTVNVVKSAWTEGYPDIMYVDFTKSAMTIEGTVEGRSVFGQSVLPLKPDLNYLDVSYGMCRYSLTETDGGIAFELLDEYVTISVTVDGNTVNKRVVKGGTWSVEADGLADTANGYYYFWLVDGKFEWNVFFAENRIEFEYGEAYDYTRFVLCRLAKGNSTFRLQSDGAELSYDLSVTVTVDFDDSYEPILHVKNISAEGEYNGKKIGESYGGSVTAMEYKLEGLPFGYTMYFDIAVDGLDCAIASVRPN